MRKNISSFTSHKIDIYKYWHVLAQEYYCSTQTETQPGDWLRGSEFKLNYMKYNCIKCDAYQSGTDIHWKRQTVLHQHMRQFQWEYWLDVKIKTSSPPSLLLTHCCNLRPESIKSVSPNLIIWKCWNAPRMCYCN